MTEPTTTENPMTEKELRRMKWASRRGMLELDLLLEPFVVSVLPSSPAGEQRGYERLMACEDQDIYQWLMGHAQPADKSLEIIIKLVQRSSA